MASVLTIIGAIFVLLSMVSCSLGKSAIHEIQGLIHLLIAAVFFVGGAIIHRLPTRPKVRKEESE